jgi:hypothetical protein
VVIVMLIDCELCPRRAAGCDGCLVAALESPPVEVDLLNSEELWAVETLARAGFTVTLLDTQSHWPARRLPRRRGRAA